MFRFEVSWTTEEEGEQLIRKTWQSDHLSSNEGQSLTTQLDNYRKALMKLISWKKRNGSRDIE